MVCHGRWIYHAIMARVIGKTKLNVISMYVKTQYNSGLSITNFLLQYPFLIMRLIRYTWVAPYKNAITLSCAYLQQAWCQKPPCFLNNSDKPLL